MGNWWSKPHRKHDIWFYYCHPDTRSGVPYYVTSKFTISSEPNGRYTTRAYNAQNLPKSYHGHSQTETEVISAFRNELPPGTRIVIVGEDLHPSGPIFTRNHFLAESYLHPPGQIFNRNHFLAESFRAVGLAELPMVRNQRFQLHWNVNTLTDFIFRFHEDTGQCDVTYLWEFKPVLLSYDLILLTTTLPTFSISVEGKRMARKCKFAHSNTQRVSVLDDIMPVPVCRIIEQFAVEYDLRFGQLYSSIKGELLANPTAFKPHWQRENVMHHWVFYRERGGELDIDFRSVYTTKRWQDVYTTQDHEFITYADSSSSDQEPLSE